MNKKDLFQSSSDIFKCMYLPVGSFKLGPEKSVLETESDGFSSWCLFRHLRQTKNHPGVNFCKTELSHQTEPVHGSVR